MISKGQLAISLAMIGLITSAIFSQEGLSTDTGLPTRIGGNRCDWAKPGSTGTVQGTFNVTGFQNTDKPPTFTLVLYAGGVFVSRKRVKNGGTYYFYCVPDQSVSIIAEVDSTEVWTYSVGSLSPPPQTNYHDISFAWVAAREAMTRRNEVISAQNSYERTKENQKDFEKAVAKLREDNGVTSAKMLEALIKNDPNDFVALTELGNIYCNNRRFAEAQPLFEKALALKPDFLNALFGIGRSALGLKANDRAIEALLQAYKLKPDSADINHFLGEAYLQNKQGTLAVKYMRRAMELSPLEKADLHLRIAWLYDAAGAKDLAAEEYKLLLQQKPNFPDKEKLQRYIAENAK